MAAPYFEFQALRGVGNVELNFDPDQRVYALFGSNGVGKTKCLEAIFQACLFRSKYFVDYSAPILMDMSCLVAGGYSGEMALPDIPKTGSIDFLHSLQDMKKHSMPVIFLGAGRRGHINGKEVGADTGKILPIGTFEARRTAYFDSLVRGMRSNFSDLGMSWDVGAWFVTRAQSANPYQKQADNRKIEIDTLLELLHQLDGRYDPGFLQVAGDNSVSLRVNSQITELRHLSSGFSSLLKMLQAIISGYASCTNEVQLARINGIVVIDEIESHLHNAWQSKIVTLLKRLFPNTTFYIASHSSLVLSQLEDGEAYLLARAGDGVVRAGRIDAPNKRAFADVLEDAFGINLNQMKRQTLEADDQTAAKAKLLDLLSGGAQP